MQVDARVSQPKISELAAGTSMTKKHCESSDTPISEENAKMTTASWQEACYDRSGEIKFKQNVSWKSS